MGKQPHTKIYEYPTLQLVAEGIKLDVLNDLTHLGKISQAMQLRLELALQEAVANSVEHGNLGLLSEWKNEICEDGVDRFSKEKQSRLKNPLYSQRRVKISVKFEDAVLEISVHDEGPGFDSSRYTQCTGLEPYGRGLAMIRANMDEVSFGDGGRLIRMIKRF